MALMGVVVFVALYFVEAGYGYLFNPKFGFPLSNKVGWVLMEAPAFLVMAWWCTKSTPDQTVQLVLAALYLLHYFQRSFIFPLLMRGRSKMPVGIALMGLVFNSINAFLIGCWLFELAPAGFYADWFTDLRFWAGLLIFLLGMGINMQADHIVRNLRKPGDTRHYIPRGGMFRYVSSANYFGELVEWTGFAIATWSWTGALFVWWTFANLAPRSASLYKRYEREFGEEFTRLGRKRILPFIY
ncbi:MAG: DUF1295 domain-containing protein [Rikenellaceae bacterium]|nr:DUF1295 domain-containing protein [Rikenellaceae bacterium]